MVTVGMLHSRKHPSKVDKAFAWAAVAKMEGVNFYYFSPQGVNFEANVISGYVYEEGQWIEQDMKFPDVIYNACGMKTDEDIEVYTKLSKIVPFTSHSVGNKMSVYRRISKMPEFVDYLIPSIRIDQPEDVLDTMKKYKKVIMKPVSGSQGRGIWFIEQDGERFHTIIDTEQTTQNREQLLSSIQDLLREQAYLVQPYISCRTKDGNPYDFRLHVQKDGEGKWMISIIYPRIGTMDRVTSNLARGGSMGTFRSFLEREFGDERRNMRQTLEKFADRFTNEFESTYDIEFDELGIDIGVDENNKLWIFEVNWRPGNEELAFTIAKNLVPYAVYVANQHKST
ncbi:alpha-L-glutamate ligase [Sporosarcina sp. P18a]|uniref:YheC/YheD family endospore coat-associated protein n=1 Tax=Sporosarcina sp. P18a TaxID=2048259 RepID=UPI000C16CC15|nr:YheC/YheD family protein [Sporosarcina sp. P18a]PIC79175.1 alpha-L-glutamate ligase [Sporosarcina sp. P18a]